MRIVVARSCWSEVRWWDLMCDSTRQRIQFPSVLLQPLGHLSVQIQPLATGLQQIVAHVGDLPSRPQSRLH
jgi:hypothetical protein